MGRFRQCTGSFCSALRCSRCAIILRRSLPFIASKIITASKVDVSGRGTQRSGRCGSSHMRILTALRAWIDANSSLRTCSGVAVPLATDCTYCRRMLCPLHQLVTLHGTAILYFCMQACPEYVVKLRAGAAAQ